MTGIIDYNAGNIRSVELALKSLHVEYLISKNPADLAKVDRLIFPGVGDAKFAMDQLKKTGFDSFLKNWAAEKKPLIGVCLGSQIIFEYSEEGDTTCLGLLPGTVRRFPSDFQSRALKVPHMGWNNARWENGGSNLYKGIAEGTNFYFVHSYYIDPSDSTMISASVDYGISVPCSVKKGSIEAFQFHPEKSSQAGLQILANFTSATINADGELTC